jgi:hypothetical protein
MLIKVTFYLSTIGYVLFNLYIAYTTQKLKAFTSYDAAQDNRGAALVDFFISLYKNAHPLKLITLVIWTIAELYIFIEFKRLK